MLRSRVERIAKPTHIHKTNTYYPFPVPPREPSSVTCEFHFGSYVNAVAAQFRYNQGSSSVARSSSDWSRRVRAFNSILHRDSFCLPVLYLRSHHGVVLSAIERPPKGPQRQGSKQGRLTHQGGCSAMPESCRLQDIA